MDRAYILICQGFVLEEFQDHEAAQELREFMGRLNPDKPYEVVADGE